MPNHYDIDIDCRVCGAYVGTIYPEEDRELDNICHKCLGKEQDMNGESGGPTKPKVRVVAVDFDGVIHRHEDWKGRETIQGPIKPLRKIQLELNTLRSNGWKIIIHTCRANLRPVANFLNECAIPYDAINENPWAPENLQKCEKMSADVYIDDRCIPFDGTWDNMAERVELFTPWWRLGIPKETPPGGAALEYEVENLDEVVERTLDLSKVTLDDAEDGLLYRDVRSWINEQPRVWDDNLQRQSEFSKYYYSQLFSSGSSGERFMNRGVVTTSSIQSIVDLLLQMGRICFRSGKLIDMAEKIFIKRNTDSGGRWREVGLRGCLIEIHAKLSRLITKGNDDGISDNLVDLFNYCCIGLMCVREGLYIVGTAQRPVIVTGCHKGGLGETIKEMMEMNGYYVADFSLWNLEFREDNLLNVFFELMENKSAELFAHGFASETPYLINNYGVNLLGWLGSMKQGHFDVITKNLSWPIAIVNAYMQVFGESAEARYNETGEVQSRILNVCSQTYRVAQRCTTTYCASKAGLAHATKVMARELGPKGIVVNGIAPGLITDTMMSRKTNEQVVRLRGWDIDHADEYARTLIPAGRYTNREEVAEAIIRILDLPTYITGSIIDMTGGQ